MIHLRVYFFFFFFHCMVYGFTYLYIVEMKYLIKVPSAPKKVTQCNERSRFQHPLPLQIYSFLNIFRLSFLCSLDAIKCWASDKICWWIVCCCDKMEHMVLSPAYLIAVKDRPACVLGVSGLLGRKPGKIWWLWKKLVGQNGCKLMDDCPELSYFWDRERGGG